MIRFTKSSVHIADFGTALILDEGMTETTHFAGTLEYMAPEAKQVKNTKKPYNPFAADGQ